MWMGSKTEEDPRNVQDALIRTGVEGYLFSSDGRDVETAYRIVSFRIQGDTTEIQRRWYKCGEDEFEPDNGREDFSPLSQHLTDCYAGLSPD